MLYIIRLSDGSYITNKARGQLGLVHPRATRVKEDAKVYTNKSGVEQVARRVKGEVVEL